MTTNTFKSVNLLKAGLIGVVAAAGFGLVTLPARADEINQGGVQTTGQEGVNNTSVEQNTQNAEIKENQQRIGRPERTNRSKDTINQNSDQLTDQYGRGNTSVQQNTQNGRIKRDSTTINR